MAETLGDALPKEIARVRDKLLPIYDSMPAGALAASLMRADLDRAARAMIEGDPVEMCWCYELLKDWTE